MHKEEPRDGQDMRVEVKRDADFRVAQALARDLGVDAGRQQVRGVSMPQIVEADAGQGGLA
jgi:hypothetical protein